MQIVLCIILQTSAADRTASRPSAPRQLPALSIWHMKYCLWQLPRRRSYARLILCTSCIYTGVVYLQKKRMEAAGRRP